MFLSNTVQRFQHYRMLALLFRVLSSIVYRAHIYIRNWGFLYASFMWCYIFVTMWSDRRTFEFSSEEQQRLRYMIRDEGFYVMQSILTEQEVGDIFERIQEHERQGWFIQETVQVHFYDRLHEIIPPIQLDTIRKRIQPIVETYLGMPLKNRPDVSIYRTDQTIQETSSFLWHHDSRFCNVNVVIYLSSVDDEDDGPLQVIPHSFKYIHSGYNYASSRCNIRQDFPYRSAIGQVGDAVFFDTACIHRGGVVRRKPRYALSFYFSPWDEHIWPQGGILKQKRWPVAMPST